MNKSDIDKRLKELKIEDFIWIIYIGIIFFSWYSNSLERKYYLNNDELSKKKYRKIMTIIFSILVVVYLYFLKDSYDGLVSLKKSDTNKKKNLTMLSFIASLMIFISGLLFLYISLEDDDLNVEIAFN